MVKQILIACACVAVLKSSSDGGPHAPLLYYVRNLLESAKTDPSQIYAMSSD